MTLCVYTQYHILIPANPKKKVFLDIAIIFLDFQNFSGIDGEAMELLAIDCDILISTYCVATLSHHAHAGVRVWLRKTCFSIRIIIIHA